ncbi:sulfatase [Pseudemcibacter aquimaris]|uniref:sulfatase family protein n=1 Tax=Pseudemcibacter aquimaris TaxID=2857064 RepID=UPI0020110771|nr:sulfatase [Pseudemcibacter aquimaris]MCC3860066.1 sulfatase [Pseudemcibacter aquimaris]WDU57395.1 sulfatase [Pseudemcibacter aquimaris]
MKNIYFSIISFLLYSAFTVILFAQDLSKRPNIIYILTDDQRYDELGILNPLLDTPNMDAIAENGVHFKNAFVTTALCSPSRATILTGQYANTHRVVDNNAPIREGTIFFPSYLQNAGYKTAFIGKWHMGAEGDQPQPGFDKWISFEGQGNYYPINENGTQSKLNVDGKHVNQKGYITDELTDYAIDWLDDLDTSEPFFLYFSHKAVHADFEPAKRHANQYDGKQVKLPDNMANTEENYKGKPRWVKDQRSSWHGVDFPYHSTLDVGKYKMQYHRTLSAVDDSIGRLMAWLEEKNLTENTIIMLMGDNGFMFGEHGLIDKRNAYEESMRVPLLAMGPGFEKGKTVYQVVANLDIAPTILEIADVEKPDQFQGRSFKKLADNNPDDDQWNNEFVYEYFWEYNFPQTPTTFAVRTDRYKLIQYHGVWDREELYDIINDPTEMNNLANDPDLLDVKIALRKRLYELTSNQDGEHVVPYTERKSIGSSYRDSNSIKAADFPEEWLRNGTEVDLNQGHIPDSPEKFERLKRLQQEADQQN